MKARDPTSSLTMSIKAKPYLHQVEAFNFVCERFGLIKKGGASDETDEGQLPSVRQDLPKAGNPAP